MEALFAQWEWGAPPFLGGAPREQRVGGFYRRAQVRSDDDLGRGGFGRW